MTKHNQKPTDMFNKQDVTVYLTYIKILKDLNILNFRRHIPEAIFKVLRLYNTLKMACGMWSRKFSIFKSFDILLYVK